MAEEFKLPEVAYATFARDIDAFASQKFTALYQHVNSQKNPSIKEIHVLLHSMGGCAHDGIYIYNLLRAFPVPVSIYNGGNVCSAAVTAYLGAPSRFTVENGLFMLHRVTSAVQTRATYESVYSLAESVRRDDDRVAKIYQDELIFPDAVREKYVKGVDCWLTAAEAISAKLANAVGSFSPPRGEYILNLGV